MTTTLLIGRSDVALSLANGANYVVMTKFQAAYTGRVEEIHLRVKASTSGNVTLGVYADSSGSPGALLATTASTLVSSDSERYLTIALTSSLAVTYGTYYWIAFNSDVSIVGARVETSTRRYKAYAYASLPDPAGSGYSSDTTYGDITAGWGNVLQSVTPSGIASTLAFGSPVLTSVARIYPSGIASTLAFGLPIVGHGVTGITVTAIASTLAIGRPFIRAAGHYIIAASYAEDTPLSNYFYVIGRDITPGRDT
jgi:hypothetical protein